VKDLKMSEEDYIELAEKIKRIENELFNFLKVSSMGKKEKSYITYAIDNIGKFKSLCEDKYFLDYPQGDLKLFYNND